MCEVDENTSFVLPAMSSLVHNNMPVEDALALVVKAFGNIFVEHEQQEHTRFHTRQHLVDDCLAWELRDVQCALWALDVFLLSVEKYLDWVELNSVCDYSKTRKDTVEGINIFSH